jgi:diguanylate cyclase (GGDEF)-like protein/PAS domain S-box-containing protein
MTMSKVKAASESIDELPEDTLRVHSAALEMIPQGVIIADKAGDILYANDAFLRMTLYSRPEIQGRKCIFLQGALTDPVAVNSVRRALAELVEFSGEILNYRRDGSAFWNELTITPVRNEHGIVRHFIGTMRDVSRRKHAEQALHDSEQRLQLALLGGDLALWDWQLDDGRLTVNQRWLAMLGLATDGPPPTIDTWTALVHPEDRVKLENIVEQVILQPTGQHFEIELRARRSDGNYIWILDKGAVVARAADGTPLRVSGTHLDITARKEAAEKMHRLALFDALTGLPNRFLLLDRLSEALIGAEHSSEIGALLFIDLDNFKQINDARGHLVGDILLQHVAQRLNTAMMPRHTVARLGSDEFVVLANPISDDLDMGRVAAQQMAEQMHEALKAPFTVDGVTYHIGGSIGVTLFPKPGDTIDNLIREADTAMYWSKAKVREGNIAFYETAMQVEAERKLSMEHDLQKAVAAQGFDVYLESKVDRHGQEVGGELLLRWSHPVHGSIGPAQFIPVAEACGQIIPLGNWVIEQACQALVQLQTMGCERTLSVNVSPRQLLQEGFVSQVRDTLRRTGALAGQLIFEVTEGLFIENWEVTVTSMTELVAMGIRFSIDDFGTGYSSLAYLQRLPIHELKIDRSFMENIPGDAGNQAIVHAILAVARHLQLHVVAEGVETRTQLDFLVSSECECMQGYLFGGATPLSAWLSSIERIQKAHASPRIY